MKGIETKPNNFRFVETKKTTGLVEEIGKLADFVVTKEDIMTAGEELLPHIKVVYTYSGGKKVYEQR